MSAESPAAVLSSVHASPSDPLGEAARWAAWKARGARHDQRVRARLRVALPLLAVVAVALFYAGMVR